MELTKSVKKTRFFTFSEYLTIKKQKNRKMVVTAKNGGKKVTLLVHLENYFKMLKFRIWASFTLMLPKNCVEHLRIFSGAFYPPPRPPPGEMICISNIYRYKPCCSQLYSLCFISALAPYPVPPPLFPTHLPSFPLLTLFTAAAQLILEMAIVFWTWKRLSFRRKTNDRRLKWIVSRKEKISFFRNERKRVNCKILVDFYVRHG